MFIRDIYKIINDAWENKDQINPNSDKKIKVTINQIIADLTVEKLELQKRLMGNGLLINILKKQ